MVGRAAHAARRIQVLVARAALQPRHLRRRVDADAAHQAEVQQHVPVALGVAAVQAAADSEGQRVGAEELDGGDYICGACGHDTGGGRGAAKVVVPRVDGIEESCFPSLQHLSFGRQRCAQDIQLSGHGRDRRWIRRHDGE